MKVIINKQIIDLNKVYAIDPIKYNSSLLYFEIFFYNTDNNVIISKSVTVNVKYKYFDLEIIKLNDQDFKKIFDEFEKEYNNLVQLWSALDIQQLPKFTF